MANYYTTQMIAFEEIDKRLGKILESGNNINISLFILDFTKIYPLSPKSVKNRIELYVKANKDNLEIVGDEVRLL